MMVLLAVLLRVEPERVLQMPVDAEPVVSKVFGVVADAAVFVDVFIKRRRRLCVVVLVGIVVVMVCVLVFVFGIVVSLKVGIVSSVVGEQHVFFQICGSKVR